MNEKCVDSSNWLTEIAALKAQDYRFSALWARDLKKHLEINACFELAGKYLWLRSLVSESNPEIASIVSCYSAANRLERHTHDMFGIVFVGNQDERRWTRHQAWNEDEFPLRKKFPVSGFNKEFTVPDIDYPFFPVSGSGVYEIPVGPVHAGIIEPGHFRFHAAGEDVIRLEERLGYLHKGIEKIAEGRHIPGLIKLAGRVSGDSTVAYAISACMAVENAYQIKIPKRASFIRAIMLERERVANHMGDFAAICNDVGFSFAYFQAMRLKELWLRVNNEVFGSRFMMDCVVVGGVNCDLFQDGKVVVSKEIDGLRKELVSLYEMCEENSSLHDRLKTTGKLTFEQAKHFGVLGYMARASGVDIDLRRDAPYAPYDQLEITVPIHKHGDVLARVRVRAQEILVSLGIIKKMLEKLPEGGLVEDFELSKPATEGIGVVEGWRGEIFTYISFGTNGIVDRYFPRDPSWFNWLALEELIHGNIVPDFPVCNKSVNGSYSGVDL